MEWEISLEKYNVRGPTMKNVGFMRTQGNQWKLDQKNDMMEPHVKKIYVKVTDQKGKEIGILDQNGDNRNGK